MQCNAGVIHSQTQLCISLMVNSSFIPCKAQHQTRPKRIGCFYIRLLKMKYGRILSTSILLFSTHVYKANQWNQSIDVYNILHEILSLMWQQMKIFNNTSGVNACCVLQYQIILINDSIFMFRYIIFFIFLSKIFFKASPYLSTNSLKFVFV